MSSKTHSIPEISGSSHSSKNTFGRFGRRHTATATGQGCPEPAAGLKLKGEASSDGQVGDKYFASRLRAQQHRDKEDGQAHHRRDENRTRQADLVGGRV
jgi:hypothetical protein